MTDQLQWSLKSSIARSSAVISSGNYSNTTAKNFLESPLSVVENSRTMVAQQMPEGLDTQGRPTTSTLHRVLASSTHNVVSAVPRAKGVVEVLQLQSSLPSSRQPFSQALSFMSQNRVSAVVGINNAINMQKSSTLTDASPVESDAAISNNRSRSSSTSNAGTQSLESPATLHNVRDAQTPVFQNFSASSPVNAYSAKMQVGFSSDMNSECSPASAPLSPVAHFLNPSPAGDNYFAHSMGSPTSTMGSCGSPDRMDMNVQSVDVDDSSYSDATFTDSGMNRNNNNDHSKDTDTQNQPPTSAASPSSSSPTKRKRVRKSRAKPIDPEQKVIVKRTRRVRANDRERSRMHGLNDAMDELRKHIPSDGSAGKMTKIDTLRTAANYIRVLKMMLGETDKSEEGLNLAGCSWSSGDVAMALNSMYNQSLGSPDSTGMVESPDSAQSCDPHHHPHQDFSIRLAGVPDRHSGLVPAHGDNGCVIVPVASPPPMMAQGQYPAFQNHNTNCNNGLMLDNYALGQNVHLPSTLYSDTNGSVTEEDVNGGRFHKNMNGLRRFGEQNDFVHQENVHYGSYIFQQSSQCY